MKILVTGGCGFIGSTLVDALISKGHDVIVIDDLSSGSLDNLNANATFIKGSINDDVLLTEILSNVQFCFHLAAIVSVIECSKHWMESSFVNDVGTRCVLNAARKTVNGNMNVPVVLASSAAVYGDSVSLPLSENEPVKPMSPYGADKLMNEVNAKMAFVHYGVPTRCYRFFNVYGPRQSADNPYAGVIIKFIKNLLDTNEVIIYGDGHQTRDFIYVGDVVSALCQCVGAENLCGDVYNLCTNKETDLLTLFNIINGILKKDGAIIYKDKRAGEIYRSCGDGAKAEKFLDFKPTVSMQDGLTETIRSFVSSSI